MKQTKCIGQRNTKN